LFSLSFLFLMHGIFPMFIVLFLRKFHMINVYSCQHQPFLLIIHFICALSSVLFTLFMLEFPTPFDIRHLSAYLSHTYSECQPSIYLCIWTIYIPTHGLKHNWRTHK
jgi:hypothetical protein